MKPALKRAMNTLVAVLVAYVLLLLVARLFEGTLIFFPQFPGRLTGDWNPANLKKEDVWLRSEDGVKLHAWWIPSGGAEYTFIALHGNAANIANRADAYAFLARLPVNVLAVEYRGYGRSEGRPSEEGFYRDARAGYDYVTRERGIEAGRVVVLGQSIGTPVAANLAAERRVAGVVLEAPFPSAAAVARRIYFFLPGLSQVIRSRFETSERLAAARRPLLVVHSEDDPVMPFALGEEVFRRAPEPKMFLRARGGFHEEAAIVIPEEYAARLREFLGLIAGAEQANYSRR